VKAAQRRVRTPPTPSVGGVVRPIHPSCLSDLELRCAMLVQRAVGLEGTPDLEPDSADLDGEHPVALVQDGDAMLKCLFGLPGGAQDRD
jgi:hypothetical protein